MTTSDVCHAIFKPLTAPKGWRDVATLINAKERWYKHLYKNEATDEVRDVAPPGTRSVCELMLEQPSTAAWVGRPASEREALLLPLPLSA